MNSKQAKEFMKAVDEIVKEKGIDKDVIIEAMESGMANAYKKNTGIANVKAKVNPETGQIRLFTYKKLFLKLLMKRHKYHLKMLRKL